MPRPDHWRVGELIDPPGSDPGAFAGSTPASPALPAPTDSAPGLLSRARLFDSARGHSWKVNRAWAWARLLTDAGVTPWASSAPPSAMEAIRPDEGPSLNLGSGSNRWACESPRFRLGGDPARSGARLESVWRVTPLWVRVPPSPLMEGIRMVRNRPGKAARLWPLWVRPPRLPLMAHRCPGWARGSFTPEEWDRPPHALPSRIGRVVRRLPLKQEMAGSEPACGTRWQWSLWARERDC